MSGTQILLIGDDQSGGWHPLQPVREELEKILKEKFQLTVTNNYDDLSTLDTSKFAACISYADIGTRNVTLTSEQVSGLLKFIADGGGLLAIHNGISLARSYELLQVIGAKFVAHPPFQPLHFYRVMNEHPLLEGVEDFTVDEEPYQFEFDSFTPRTVFLEYEYNGKRWPSAWEHKYGLGKVVYLHPGHTEDSFKPEAIQRLILNSVSWIAGLDF
ncbi:ThuA domain-containing protein [Paenibacillus oenotherae]|uniref:ThuA domain-containing protein n=1 Tax=Paenibacillus oenotherae TaxID=1435645 RepID=A0ABS7DCU5_9BACL|nr:ThuA domain-containing protein [Paenibacillus oenotherae]MBW7477327.1 ThuA domain-containing protein [Paenibacillus oenotherae]